MAFKGNALKKRTQHDSTVHADLTHDADGWPAPEAEARDWKKVALVVGLGALSWVATYVGMLELIESNMGELPLVHRVIIACSVAMLMTMIIWLLDQIFSPVRSSLKLAYVMGYVFLTAISVGFGFGFYWKVLESRSEATRSAESAVSQVQNALHGASTRMEQLNATLLQLTEVSTKKAVEEREKGTSCPNSRPGDGPRRKLRDADASRFSYASQFIGGRVESVKGDMLGLDKELAKLAKDDKSIIDTKSGTRNEFMRALGRRLDLTVTGFNAFRTDPQLRQIRADLADRGERTIFPNGRGGTFSCPDQQLQAALRGVVRAIDQLPELGRPKIAAVEGSEATLEAFRRLGATFYGVLALKLPPSADELRALQKKAVQSVDGSGSAAPAVVSAQPVGLSKRDYIPLSIAIFVDLCLLLVSMGRPMNRLGNLVPRMREAERGPVIQILSRFNDIHRDRQIRENFEIFSHVVFDYAGNYYVAVPLDAPLRENPKQREELRLEAQLLSNLFASFEKEKIFKRLDNQWVSLAIGFEPTARIARARLRRQGSKFANSEAFRIYKFTDGAWSEIILGAVMGAAKRAEAGKRKRQLLEEARQGAQAGQTHSAPESQAPIYTQRGRQDAPPPWPGLDATARGAARSNEHSNGMSRNGSRDGNRNGVHAAANGKAPGMANGYEQTLSAKYGAYAPHVARETSLPAHGEEHGTGEGAGLPAANSNTQPQRRNGNSNGARRQANAKPASDVICLPSVEASDVLNGVGHSAVRKPVVNGNAAAKEETIVTLTRETATFSIPVSEAKLPRNLFADAQDHAIVAPARSSNTLPAPTPEPTDDVLDGEQIVDTEVIENTDVKIDPTSDTGSIGEDVAAPKARQILIDDFEHDAGIKVDEISRRFAPPPAE